MTATQSAEGADFLDAGLDLAHAEGQTGPRRRVPLTVMGAYGLGNTVERVASYLIGTYVFFYYTAVLHMSATLAALAFFITIMADSVTDIVLGALTDRTRSRLGRRHPWMLAGIPLALITLMAMFLPPDWVMPRDGELGLGLFLWLTVSMLLFRISLSVFNVPYLALGAELSPDYRERSAVVAWRHLFGMIATAVIIFYAIDRFGPAQGAQFQEEAYPDIALFGCALILVGGLVATLGTLASRWRMHDVADDHPPGVKAFFGQAWEVTRNREFKVLFISGVLFFGAEGLMAMLGFHTNTFFWQITAADMGRIGLVYLGGLILSVPLCWLFWRLFEKHVIVVTGLVILLIAQTTPPLLGVLGVVPVGQDQTPIGLLMTGVFFCGIGVTLATVAFGSMLADVADEHELQTGRRQEGIFLGAQSMASKLAWGAGGLVGGVIIDLVGLPDVDKNTPPAEILGVLNTVPDLTRTLLALASGPLCAGIALIGTLVLLGYRLNRQRHDEIRAALSARRGPAAAL